MLARHLLQHDNVGIGLVEEFVDLIDPLVFDPEIEGRDARNRGVGASFGLLAPAKPATMRPTLIAASRRPGRWRASPA